MIKFEYNGKIYKPSNFEKKLKALGITKDDIIILEEFETKGEQQKKEFIKYTTPQYNENTIIYIFWNKQSKGWYDSKLSDLSDWSFNDKENFILVGQTEKNESVYEAHKRLFKKAIGL